MKSRRNVRLLCYFVLACMFVVCASTPPLCAGWPVRSWSPPPKTLSLLHLPQSEDGSEPIEHMYPNLCDEYFFWICADLAYVKPYRAFPWLARGADELKRFKEDEHSVTYLETARRNGYRANYIKLPKPQANSVVPILGYLFYIRSNADASDDYVKPCQLFRIDASDRAYQELGFRKKEVYSFPGNDFIAQWFEGTYKHMDRFPKYTAHLLRGHGIIVRRIESFGKGQGASSLKAEMAVFPWVGPDPKGGDFRWYSVGDELTIPWAFPVPIPEQPGVFERSWTTDPRYYKITNIVLPNSPIIKVQPDDGGKPIECKPIGWVDIDIHGRKEPAEKKE